MSQEVFLVPIPTDPVVIAVKDNHDIAGIMVEEAPANKEEVLKRIDKKRGTKTTNLFTYGLAGRILGVPTSFIRRLNRFDSKLTELAQSGLTEGVGVRKHTVN